MGLYERLIGTEEPKIHVASFATMLTDRRRNRVTRQQVIDAFTISAGEETELDALIARMAANRISGTEVREVLDQAEHEMAPYDTVAAVKTRFGV